MTDEMHRLLGNVMKKNRNKHYMTLRAAPILYNTLNYIIVSRHQINTCTVLYFSVLYCIKIRKFAHKQGTTVSKTEVHSTRERPIRKLVRLGEKWLNEYDFINYIVY